MVPEGLSRITIKRRRGVKVLGTTYKKREGSLRFGTRASEDILMSTFLSEAIYQGLPNRKACVICGALITKKVHYPCCTKDCKKKYRDWLYSL